MENGKYIVIDSGSFEDVIMFSNTISHDAFLYSFNKDNIVSAGFFAVGAEPRDGDKEDISVDVFGKSVTLKLEVRKDKDERLIKRVLRKEYW